MRRKKITKKQAQQWHARKRAKERFSLPPKAIEAMEYQIQNGMSIYCGSSEVSSNRITFHKVFYQNEIYKVIYDKVRRVVVTVLPPGGKFENEVSEKTW